MEEYPIDEWVEYKPVLVGCGNATSLARNTGYARL